MLAMPDIKVRFNSSYELARVLCQQKNRSGFLLLLDAMEKMIAHEHRLADMQYKLEYAHRYLAELTE